jgi:hypothetical protein
MHTLIILFLLILYIFSYISHYLEKLFITLVKETVLCLNWRDANITGQNLIWNNLAE